MNIKDLIFSAIFLLSTIVVAQNEVIEIPDENFRNALLNTNVVDTDDNFELDSPVDTNRDGKIQRREAEAVKHLNVFKEDISSLEGIEYFINLEELWCGKNNIEELDFSSNPKLRTLFCNHNNLKTLNVSANTQLELLHAQANYIKTIDVSNCKALKILVLTEQELETIDVSKNSNLLEFYCDYNKLTEIDISANLNLEKFECGHNQLTKLDVRKNKKLRKITCGSNKLTYLNVANGNNVTKLFIMSAVRNPELKVIYVDKPSNAKKKDFWLVDDHVKFKKEKR